MKKFFHAIIVFGTLLGMASCQPSTQHQPPHPLVEIPPQVEVVDTTRYGVCGDGTTMHCLELVATNGDTLIFNYNLSENQVVRGGLMVGDRLAVVSDTDEYGEQRATLIANLTSLLGRWTSIDKRFEVKEGGTIVSEVQAETNPWTSWKILNGQLLFDRDTFDIIELGADSLYLENANGIFVYKRSR